MQRLANLSEPASVSFCTGMSIFFGNSQKAFCVEHSARSNNHPQHPSAQPGRLVYFRAKGPHESACGQRGLPPKSKGALHDGAE